MSFESLWKEYASTLMLIARKRNMGIDTTADEARLELDINIPMSLEWMKLTETEQDKIMEEL